ncbi:MAG TPA: TonB-dependent receptor [Sphingopyxis sp.]|nr:TonB-dependent receptor [Sphingopyxis sp.]
MALSCIGLMAAGGAQAQSSSPANGTADDEIIVTAMLREQSLQDVPIAVTAFQGKDLERMGAVNYTDIAASVPNFSSDSLTNAGFTIPSLRGIGLTGATDSAISNNPATGIYIDGVYLNAAGANLFSVLDIERVEILRGPQGTLYGRNTIGGVINVISQRPSEELSAKLTGSYGSFDRAQVSGSISGPIARDLFAVRIGGTYLRRDGYVKNLFAAPLPNTEDSARDTDGLESFAARGSLLFTPSDRIEFVLAGDYGRDETTYPGYNVEDGASPDLSAFLGPVAGAYTDTDGDVHAVSYNSKNFERSINWGGSLTGTWKGDDVRLVSITGYRRSNYLDDLSDIDGTPVNIFQQFIEVREKSFSQELRLHYDTERLNLVAGAFYYKKKGQQDAANDILGVERDLGYPLSGGVGPGLLGGGITRTVVDIRTDSYSLFGHASFALTEQLRLEAGGRWTRTDVDFSRPVSRAELGDATNPIYNGGNRFDELPVGVLLVDLGNSFGVQERRFSRFTPHVGLTWEPSAAWLIYAKWSRGFREGGFSSNPPNATGISSFGPETLTSYEVGFKADILDRLLRLNVAAYHYRYSDQQVEVASLSPAGLFVEIFNSGKSKATGIEAEFVLTPSRNFRLDGNFGLQDSKFIRLNAGALGDLSGNRFPRAPTFTASLAPSFIAEFPSGDTLTFRPEWSHRSDEYMNVTNDPLVKAGTRDLINASLTFETADGRWSLSAWARNLFDEEYITKVVDLSSFLGYRLRRYGEPRSVGVTVGFRY